MVTTYACPPLLLWLLYSFQYKIEVTADPILDDLIDDDCEIRTNDEAGRCHGLRMDIERLHSLTNDDVNKITNPSPGNERSFNLFRTKPVVARGSNIEIGRRVRLKETIQNVDIYGAEAVLTLEACGDGQICATNIESLSGKTFNDDINVVGGYKATYSEEEARQKLSVCFGANIEDVGELSLEVYISQRGDFLAYIGEVFAVNSHGHPRLYDIVIDAHTLKILHSCNRQGLPALEESQRYRQRGLRSFSNFGASTTEGKNQQPQRNLNCGNCDTKVSSIDWSSTQVACPINSLYLNDTGRSTMCVRDRTDSYSGPGAVAELFWEGTYDCHSTVDESSCEIVPLPDCPDATSDTQFAALKTMEFYQHYLGVMGGLSQDASDPRPAKAYVHYENEYCNAFFRSSRNAIFLGDCDCSWRTPLASVDIIAHELTHGVTKYSSSLVSEFQAGGLNEAFSDIVGVAVEALVSDSQDIPDFIIGEMLGNHIRSVADPVGRYITSACDFHPELDPHHASGPVDLAYATAVMECEDSACASLEECMILLSSAFMYSNIHALTRLSGYLDAAEATCGLVDEFFTARAPNTTCDDPDQVKRFIRKGWCQVNIRLNSNCEASFECGEGVCGSGGDDGIPDSGISSFWTRLMNLVVDFIPWFTL